jgi:hypothetical protein
LVISVTLVPLLAVMRYGTAEAFVGGSATLHIPAASTGTWRPNTNFPVESISSIATGTEAMESGDHPQMWLD